MEARGEAFEGLPFAALGGLLPDGALLWAGNSMPVRDMDDWLSGSAGAIRPLSNRGANGIDGVVSTALGAAAAEVGPVALVVGDLSFLHDLNALVAARLHALSATIVLIDNDGGGIFSFLPQATADSPAVGLPEHYEELFGTPHGIDFGPIATALGAEFADVTTGDLRDALAASIGRPGVRVLRYRTDRAGTSSCTARRPPRSRQRWRGHDSGRDRRPPLGGPDARHGVPLLLLHGFTGRGAGWGSTRDGVRTVLPRDRRGPAGPRPIGHPGRSLPGEHRSARPTTSP